MSEEASYTDLLNPLPERPKTPEEEGRAHSFTLSSLSPTFFHIQITNNESFFQTKKRGDSPVLFLGPLHYEGKGAGGWER